MAWHRGAHIVYVGAPNNFQDLDAAMNHVVDKGLAQIVTNSYAFNTESLHPGFIRPLEETLIQGAAEGIGIYFSSGDNSDESLVDGYVSTDFPASSPWVTAVGGTSLAVGGSTTTPARLFETGWGTFTSSWKCATSGCTWSPSAPGGWLYGAGGGVSCIFSQPAYQRGIRSPAAGPGSLCPGQVGRAVPDISAIGDPNTGYLVGQTQSFAATTGSPESVQYDEYRIGGTSLASPITAGIMALVDEARAANHQAPLGFANPSLYGLTGGALNDIIPPPARVAVVRVNYANNEDATDGLRYRLRTMDMSLSLKTGTGWDDVTGLGTPSAGFIGALNH
jgi:subtilase family serine protease